MREPGLLDAAESSRALLPSADISFDLTPELKEGAGEPAAAGARAGHAPALQGAVDAEGAIGEEEVHAVAAEGPANDAPGDATGGLGGVEGDALDAETAAGSEARREGRYDGALDAAVGSPLPESGQETGGERQTLAPQGEWPH